MRQYTNTSRLNLSVILFRYKKIGIQGFPFKWLYCPYTAPDKRPKAEVVKNISLFKEV